MSVDKGYTGQAVTTAAVKSGVTGGGRVRSRPTGPSMGRGSD